MHLFNKLRTQLNEKPYIIAIFITVFIILWMMSGGSNANEQSTSESQQRIAKVKVETLHAKPINRSLQLYGRTEPNKVARVAARQEGEVIEILVKEGQFVEQGTVILKLDKSDLDSQITAAKALLEQSEVEYQGALKLKQKGLNDQSALARAKASLEQAKASLANL
ncbi:MAG: efflux RND transporter periplasmic adaptor subunit, partial [Pseudoalteromonas spongiae]